MIDLHTETLPSTAINKLILLHGWGHTSESLRPLARLLSKTHQPTLIDLPGFGKSPVPQDLWSAFDYATRIKDFMDARGISQSDFLGHSFGGKVALSMAIKYPERVRSLILMASSGLHRNRTFLQRCRIKGIKAAATGCKLIDKTCGTTLYASKFIPAFGSADYKNAGVMRPILVKSVNEDYTQYLSSVTAKTLLLWGENDTETPPEVGKRFHKALQNSSFILMPNKTHQPFDDVGSHLCAHYILQFFQEK